MKIQTVSFPIFVVIGNQYSINSDCPYITSVTGGVGIFISSTDE